MVSAAPSRPDRQPPATFGDCRCLPIPIGVNFWWQVFSWPRLFANRSDQMLELLTIHHGGW